MQRFYFRDFKIQPTCNKLQNRKEILRVSVFISSEFSSDKIEITRGFKLSKFILNFYAKVMIAVSLFCINLLKKLNLKTYLLEQNLFCFFLAKFRWNLFTLILFISILSFCICEFRLTEWFPNQSKLLSVLDKANFYFAKLTEAVLRFMFINNGLPELLKVVTP
jgi:hypothetical protein